MITFGKAWKLESKYFNWKILFARSCAFKCKEWLQEHVSWVVSINACVRLVVKEQFLKWALKNITPWALEPGYILTLRHEITWAWEAESFLGLIAEEKVRVTRRMRKPWCVIADLNISGREKCEQPPRAKNRQYLIASKKMGPQNYSHKTLDSTNNRNEPESKLFPEECRKVQVGHLATWDPKQRI